MASAASTQLLPFQEKIVKDLFDTATSDLLVLARGLGLRKIVCTLLQIYDGPHNLVLLVNATADEEASIGEELGIMGCRKPGLRIVGYEMGRKERQNLYKQGGLISVTSRILIVDMLQSDVPTELITGLVVLHAERVTALSLEAFILRLFREKNSDGFVKAFSDDPEHITSGLYPLKSIMKELHLRNVHIYPRFHEEVKSSLERRKADVVELYQPLSESMRDIHDAIVQCMTATLNELKRTNSSLELDDFTVEHAYARSFDAVVRRQLDPVWHQVGPKTKQLVGDLATLRNLLNYLLTYDPLAFHAYLETILAANSNTGAAGPGSEKRHRSPWLFMDAANTIFSVAKRRCYLSTAPKKPAGQQQPDVIDLVEDEDAWAALDEVEGAGSTNAGAGPSDGKGKQRENSRRKPWLPQGMEPVLEEPPKWALLADVLHEVEEEMIRLEPSTSFHTPGTNTVLVLCASQRTCDDLSEYMSSLDPNSKAPRGEQGRKLMEKRLKTYLWWKGRLNDDRTKVFHMPRSKNGVDPASTQAQGSSSTGDGQGVSEALRRKDAARKERIAQRRRIRGGAPGTSGTTRDTAEAVGFEEEGMTGKEREKLGILVGEREMRKEAERVADFLATQHAAVEALSGTAGVPAIDMDEELAASLMLDAPTFDEYDFDSNYGLLAPHQTVLIRAYGDDGDDRILAEIKPRFIVMYEPSIEFIRRIECYRSSNPGLGVRVYFMMYHLSSEEHRYLAGLRREKEAFERLIKERGSMVIVLGDERRAGVTNESVIKAISTRIAGGKQVSEEPAQVIVDIREFRSTLPSLLHAARLRVIPATLTVGDYILTPDICVERKSIPDLVSSFTSGRLYAQCELMSVHYKQPILLIEFEEHKAFSLDMVGDMKSYAKATGKYPAKKKPSGDSSDAISTISIQSKIVLLTLSFPRLRILWSSSPFVTADLFADLKANQPEPDAVRAVAVGAEEQSDPNDPDAGVNAQAEDLIRALPGITAKNVQYVMRKVGSVRALCELDLPAVQEILGVEPGKACWEFIHRGE